LFCKSLSADFEWLWSLFWCASQTKSTHSSSEKSAGIKAAVALIYLRMEKCCEQGKEKAIGVIM
jgi:hypothetical protein